MICRTCMEAADMLSRVPPIFPEEARKMHKECEAPATCTCQHRARPVLTEGVQPG